MAKRFVLFDLDGTLIDSLEDLADASNYALEQFGYPRQERVEDFRYFVGDGVPKLMERILPPGEATQERIEALRSAYVKRYLEHCCDKTRPYPGVAELLAALKEKGIGAAVVSNKPDDQTRRILGELFAPGTFAAAAGNQPGYRVKPDPGLTWKVMGELGADPADCLFVGDSGVDMRTAENSGATGVGVLWGFRTREELLENGAAHLIETPGALLALL